MASVANYAFMDTAQQLFQWRSDLWEIILLSLRISLISLTIAVFIALPLGGMLAVKRFPKKQSLVSALNHFIGLPALAISLPIYLALSRVGDTGVFGMISQPAVFISVQALLITPMLMALSLRHIEAEWNRLRPQLRSWRMNAQQALPTLFWQARVALFAVLLTGFGRATADLALFLLVGGSMEFLLPSVATRPSPAPGVVSLHLVLIAATMLLLIALLAVAPVLRDRRNRR